jgi:hypothetical protein
VKQENHSVCPVCLENTNQKKEHLNVKTAGKIFSPTSPHNQHATSVMMGNQQSSVVLDVFHVHLEKQERHVCRAKLGSIDQQKMNRMKKQTRQSV